MTFAQRLTFLVLASFVLAGCKFVPTAEKHKQTSANSAHATDKGFDQKVAELWGSKLMPYMDAKAGSLPDVLAAIAAGPDQAGAKFGYKEKGGSSPWTLLAKIEGRVVGANTQSRAATLDVDVTDDGKADVQVQIGPVIRGTAIRDSLDFVNFNDFTNQIDFAQFGKAFNTYANDRVLKDLPRDNLVGKRMKALGAFPLPQGPVLPLLTPVSLVFTP